MRGKAKSLVARLGALALLAGTLAMLAAPAGAAPAGNPDKPGLLGHWLSPKERLIVEFYPCGSEVCGRIAWLENTHRDGKLRRDRKNPDPALRDRPWCGIDVVWDLEPDGDGRWEGGKVYDPKRGQNFSLEATLEGEDRLKLRAYLGLKFLGKTEVWTRPDPDQEIGCVPAS